MTELFLCLGGSYFALSALQLVLDRRTSLTRTVSGPTASILWAFAICYWNLGLHYFSGVEIITAAAWTALFVFRPARPTEPPVRLSKREIRRRHRNLYKLMRRLEAAWLGTETRQPHPAKRPFSSEPVTPDPVPENQPQSCYSPDPTPEQIATAAAKVAAKSVPSEPGQRRIPPEEVRRRLEERRP